MPTAIPLPGNPDSAVAQMLLVDLLLHSWRTTDNLIKWEARFPAYDAVTDALQAAQRAFGRWGRTTRCTSGRFLRRLLHRLDATGVDG